VPGVGVPVAADQPFWARRAARLGTGPEPVTAARLDAGRLTAAIVAATGHAEYRRAAGRVAARLRQEDGAAAAVAAVERIAEEWPARRAVG
jgi:UDP:flavonoid glycosyltransferase YjiC (YdhE family)